MPRPQPKDSNLENDVRSLQSKLDLVVQQLNNLDKNVKILGKTVVIVNDRVKGIQAGPGSRGASVEAGKIKELEKQLDKLKQDVAETKHTVDMVNPLEFVTRDVVREMISDASKE